MWLSVGFGSQSLALKSNFKDFKIFPVWNKIIQSLDLCPGVWEYHSVLHGTPLVFCAQCSVPVGKLGPHFVNPERAPVTPRAFHIQENYSVPSDQNIGCGRLQHHDGSYINPSRKPTGSKGFRSLALNAFLLATCRQALELFYWQLRETSFDSEVERKRWLLPFSHLLPFDLFKIPFGLCSMRQLTSTSRLWRLFEQLGKGWEEAWSHDDEEKAKCCIQNSSWLNYSCCLLYFLWLILVRFINVAITQGRWKLVG